MEWSDGEKYLTELKKTILLKNACLDLREEFDEYQSERLNLICKSYLPKCRNNSRDIPSRKASYKINALKIQYEIFQLSQWLAYKSKRMEHEKKKGEDPEGSQGSEENDIKPEVLVDWQNVWKVREEKNEPAVPAVPTLKDVVEQYNAETQQELENVVELQVEQLSDASKVLGVVKIKHSY